MSKPPSAPIEPTVLAVRLGEGRAELDLVVPPDLLYCRGHFPNGPILPGVVQIDWAILLGRRHLQLGASATITLKVKFRRLVHAGDRLTLDLRYRAVCKRLFFDYRDRGETVRPAMPCSSHDIQPMRYNPQPQPLSRPR